MKISVIIPAFNEEGSIGSVIGDIDRGLVQEVIVVNNGSADNTAVVASNAGARVITENRPGYGWACLAGIASVKNPDVIVFLDGDYSDYPEQIKDLIMPIQKENADLVIGSRIKGNAQKGSLTIPQRFGNIFAAFFLSIFFKTRYSDLGPFRAITANALQKLEMSDKTFGWTIEMQMKAAFYGMKITEVPVSYRVRKAGKSKVSGTIRGVILAGSFILYYLAKSFILSFKKRT
jgi:glycosyltransferase involved in cell wall biosynthesis